MNTFRQTGSAFFVPLAEGKAARAEAWLPASEEPFNIWQPLALAVCPSLGPDSKPEQRDQAAAASAVPNLRLTLLVCVCQ